jgi:putative iron-regulated protein
MKKIIITICSIAAIALGSCSKSTPVSAIINDGTLETKVINDFANVLANPNYQDIQTKAATLNAATSALIASTTDANLAATRTAWKTTRAAWESCEGYLFGPVEDNNYDPTMDDWPVNKVDLDSLINSNNPLGVTDITNLATTSKGFHAIEYIIYGVGGTKKASQITPREKDYLASLTQSLYNTTTDLRNSWDPASDNYTAQVITAGSGSAVFSSRKELFVTLVSKMAAICDEVSSEKIGKAFVPPDSTQSESSFSHNSTTDFTNNITGIRNAYLNQYNGKSGTGLNPVSCFEKFSLRSQNSIADQYRYIFIQFDQINNVRKSYLLTARTDKGYTIGT